MTHIQIEEYIIDTLQKLKVFTFAEFMEAVNCVPESYYKTIYIQSIFERGILRQTFEYFVYIG